MNRNTVLLLAVFAVGCAAGMHMDSRAQAQAFPAPAKVQKWQQYCVPRTQSWSAADAADKLNPHLKSLGEQGWELVTLDDVLYCLKRPAQ
jgi:hypothetical protein